MAKARVPKDVGGVAIPPELRRLGNRLIGRVDTRLGREALAAGMTLAAAAVIAVSGHAGDAADGSAGDPDAPEPPIAPAPPKPPVPPTPPVAPAAPEPPVRPAAGQASRAPAGPQITPAQAQAMTDALGNVAQAAIARFLAGRRSL